MQSPHRLQELDALRGIAAVAVLLFHCAYLFGKNPFFKWGVTGVDLFFIISGFVIFLTLKKTSSWKEFAINRFTRLFPTYWACVTITAIVILLTQNFTGVSVSPKQYVINLTMFQYYFKVADLDNPYWTLIIEMLFYISILLVFAFNSLQRINRIGYAVLAFIIIYEFIFPKYLPGVFYFLKTAYPLINHFPLFFSGILFYQIKFEKMNPANYTGIIVCFFISLLLFDNGGKSNNFLTLHEYAVAIAAYFLLWILYVNNKLGFIVNRVTLFLGATSYSLYLIHQFISLKVLLPFFAGSLNFPLVISIVLTMAICILLSAGITFLIEKPAMKVLRNYLRKTILN